MSSTYSPWEKLAELTGHSFVGPFIFFLLCYMLPKKHKVTSIV